MSSYRGPFHDLSPGDQADLMSFARSEDVLICEWCDEVIDQADLSVEAFEIAGGPCCVECMGEQFGSAVELDERVKSMSTAEIEAMLDGEVAK